MPLPKEKVKDVEKPEDVEEAPLQPLEVDLPPVKIIFAGMSKALPTGEGDMLPAEIELIVSNWIHKGYEIVPGSVHMSEGPNFWQIALLLVKYPE